VTRPETEASTVLLNVSGGAFRDAGSAPSSGRLRVADVDADDAMARDVAAAADMERVQQFMRLLGYYNNAVHFCVNYPRMRRGLAASALKLLAESGDAAEFITGYAQAAIGMARDAGFVLTEWTLPEPGDAGG